MIRASVQSREFLRALAFHAEPMAWATNVETSRLENGTSQETWVLSVAGSAGAFQPARRWSLRSPPPWTSSP